MNKAHILIEKETHNKLKEYCKNRGLLVSFAANNIINSFLIEKDSNNVEKN